MVWKIPFLLLAALPASTTSPGSPAQAFIIVTGEIAGLGQVQGEGDLYLVTATVRTAGRIVTVGLAPASVFRQTGFMLREGDQVVIRLFQAPGENLSPAQMVDNRTLGSSIRLRSLRGEPLWDGEGLWHGGFCRHGMERRHASLH